MGHFVEEDIQVLPSLGAGSPANHAGVTVPAAAGESRTDRAPYQNGSHDQGEVPTEGQQALRGPLFGRVGAGVGPVLAALVIVALIQTEVWRSSVWRSSTASSGLRAGPSAKSAHHRTLTQQKDDFSEGGAENNIFGMCCIAPSFSATRERRKARERLAELSLGEVSRGGRGNVGQVMGQGIGKLSNSTSGVLGGWWRGGALLVLEEGHEGRLGQTLPTLHTHFCSRYDRYPLLIVEGVAVTETLRAELRRHAPSCNLEFLPLPDVARAATDLERRKRLAHTMLSTVAPLLASRFDYVLHVSHKSLLDGDVLFDPFVPLALLEKQFGYTGIIGPPPGTARLWHIGRDLVSRYQLSNAALRETWDSPKSVDPRWFAFRTPLLTTPLYAELAAKVIEEFNLDASLPMATATRPGQGRQHKSTKTVPPLRPTQSPAASVAVRVKQPSISLGPSSPDMGRSGFLAGKGAFEEEEEGGEEEEEEVPSCAAVLTLVALVSLTPPDFLRYPGTVTFQVSPSTSSSILDNPSSMPPLPQGPETVSHFGGVELRASDAPDLQPLLDVRRVGWLGADVGTSFAFPPAPRSMDNTNDEALPKEAGPGGPRGRQLQPGQEADRPQDRRTLWLFGDTFLGQSSRTQRLPDAFFLHNTVGLLSHPPSPESMTFHWNLSSGGCPISLFLPQVFDDECTKRGTYYWPVSGLGVSLPNGSASLIISAIHWGYTVPDPDDREQAPPFNPGPRVSGDNAAPPPPSDDLLTNDTFHFTVLGTTLIVVHNPHDEPQQWEYSTRKIPGTNGEHNWYSAMALAPHHDTKDKGAGHGVGLPTGVAGSVEDMVYLLGNNGTQILGDPDGIASQVFARVSVGSLLDLSLSDMYVYTQPLPPAPAPPAPPNRRHAPPLQGSETGKAPAAGERKPSEATKGTQDKGEWVQIDTFAHTHRSAVKLAAPVFSETSVNYSPFLEKWYTTQVDWLSTVVRLYLADDLTGPWESVSVYKIPLPYSDLDYYFTYAGKAHPELAVKDNELIITYVANTFGDIDPLFAKGAKGIYVPRVVRITMTKEMDSDKQGNRP